MNSRTLSECYEKLALTRMLFLNIFLMQTEGNWVSYRKSWLLLRALILSTFWKDNVLVSCFVQCTFQCICSFDTFWLIKRLLIEDAECISLALLLKCLFILSYACCYLILFLVKREMCSAECCSEIVVCLKFRSVSKYLKSLCGVSLFSFGNIHRGGKKFSLRKWSRHIFKVWNHLASTL